MITKPKFKDSFHVEVVDSQNVCLLTEDAYWILSGRIYAERQCITLAIGTTL